MNAMKIFSVLTIFISILFVNLQSAHAEMPDITAGETKFDFKTGRYVLKDHVKVVFTDRTITAEMATVDLYNEKMNASGDVTMTSDDFLFRCDEMSGEWAKHGVEVSGNVKFVTSDGLSILAETGTFSWKTKLADFYDARILENGTEKKFKHVQFHVIEKKILVTE